MRVWSVVGALALGAGLTSGAAAARAEVVAAQPGGFEVVERVHISAPPRRVWTAIGKVGAWWSPTHTYSGDASNLWLSLEPGGCFCEHWADGEVRHMIVMAVMPGRMLRLEGALGPLGGLGVVGHLTFGLAPTDDGTDLTLTYNVGGWSKDGLDRLAEPVDQVLGLQMQRLSRYVTSRKP